MRNLHILPVILVVLLLLPSCSQENHKEAPGNQLTGLWSLHIMEQRDSTTGEWNEWRNGMQGYLLYDHEDNMSLHLTTAGYEETDLRFPNFNDTIPIEALRHLTGSYVYLAKYTIDQEKQIVQHARISHSNPGDWNKVVQRRFSFLGDTLVLKPVEESNASLRLKWVKASSN